MSFAFATCDRKSALMFLKKIYPSCVVEDTDCSVKDLLDMVECDEIRVCDPDYHKGAIISGSKWSNTTRDRAFLALKKSGLCFLEESK